MTLSLSDAGTLQLIVLKFPPEYSYGVDVR